MKLSTIRNALIKQTLIVVVILAIVAAPVLYIDSLYEEYQRKTNDIKAQGDKIASDVTTLRTQYENANKSLSSYEGIKEKQETKMLTVSKVYLRDVITNSRKKYYFGNDSFDISMTDVKPREGEKYKLSKVFAESSDVTIKLSATSDGDIFSLVKDLQDSFSAIKFSSLHLSMDKELDNNALVAIKDSGFSALINADISFTWSGLQYIKAEDIADPLIENNKDDNSPANMQRKIRLRAPR